MQYFPEVTEKEIEENHKHFRERMSLYKERGLDFIKNREFILAKAGVLDGDILEIGAGSGYTTLALAKAGYKFISIDKDREALKTTALNLAYPVRNKVSNGTYEKVVSNVKFYAMDGMSLEFENNSFENVVIVNLFHHIKSGINKMLSEADRVLRANGRLVLADFNNEGMKIVEGVHKQEGRVHENAGVSKDYVYSYFHGLGYEIRHYRDICHWIIIAKKIIEP